MLPSKYKKGKKSENYSSSRGEENSQSHKPFFGPRKLNRVLKKSHSAKKEKKRSKERSKFRDKYGESDVKKKNKDKKCPPLDESVLPGKGNKSPNSLTPEDVEIPPEVAAWRFGPAQYWFDFVGVPENPQNFNYGELGMKLGNDLIENGGKEDFPDDSYLMVSQLRWEDEVIWNGDEIKELIMQRLNFKNNAAGWVPYSNHRTAPNFGACGKNMNSNNDENMCCSSSILGSKLMGKQPNSAVFNKQEQQSCDSPKDTWYSIFPVENDELVYGIWEDEVIWDTENMKNIPEPKIPTWDPNDENLNFVIPEENDPPKQCQDSDNAPKMKVLHPHVKKSKILLGKAGVIKVVEDDLPPTPPKSPNRDEFNVSNDKYYMPQSSEVTLRLQISGSHLIRHATPVMELRAPFVPTHLGPVRLQNFHRPALRRFSHGPLSLVAHHPVYPLLKHIIKKEKQREKEREASGGGEIFFTRTADDLSSKDGDLVLVEFSEEHPPLMNLVGMCSRIKNYYKRKADKEQSPPEYRFGELAYAHTSPFLGALRQGQSLQAVENNMYRAPIYEHSIPGSDFLIIRTRKQYYIRDIDALFVAGQQCPSYEVPSPNSKRTSNFVRDFLQVFIYRLFWKSIDSPKRIKMEDIRKAFPSHSESSIRKRLKLCADFKRTGMDSNWWVIRSDFRLPSEEEIQAMVSPEQCCAYFSMLASEQRLKDAGYGENFLFAPQDGEDEDNDEEEMQLKMEDEVKVAPWNTTRAYIQAIQGKCLLQLTGPADPTGCGEGFSYVREPNKPSQSKEEQKTQPKKSVSGTDADLRRLSLNNARSLLRKFGVPGDEIKKLSRWEVIDVVRTLSTEKAKAGEEGMTKFSRGNRFSIAEHHERYKAECQRIFDLQNQVLSSNEVLSTDDEESSNEDISDIEEMGKNIENMLSNKKTSCQLYMEKEEQERKELRRMLDNQENRNQQWNKNKDRNKDEESPSNSQSLSGKVLKIYRTFCNAEGKEYTRVEFVRDPAVIEAYVKIRTTKDEAFIKQFATLDEHQKEEMKREKRCIQEQLRRIKRIQEREQMSKGRSDVSSDCGTSSNFSASQSLTPHNSHLEPNAPVEKLGRQSQVKDSIQNQHAPKRKKPKLKPDLKLKCGGCGSVGHMRTNKACPLYQPSYVPPVNVAMTEEQEEEMEKHLNDDEHLINVDGTKVKLSSKLLKHAEEMKRCTLVLKVPKGAIHAPKRRRAVNEMHCDYLTRQQRPVNRRRTDPAVVLSSILETILNEMREMPDVQPFLFPVNAKSVPDYYTIVKKPMDLQTMREKLRQKKYKSREEFLADVNQIVANSALYNGATCPITVIAKRMLNYCVERMVEREERLIHLERAINPLLDDDDQIALGYILENVVNKLKEMPEATPFLKPLNKKLLKTYENIIKEPMDFDKITKKVTLHKYNDSEEFYSDVKLILQNSILLYGKTSDVVMKAEIVTRTCCRTLQELGGKVTDESLERETSFESTEVCSKDSASESEERVGSKQRKKKKLESTVQFSDNVRVEEKGKDSKRKKVLLEKDNSSSDESDERENDTDRRIHNSVTQEMMDSRPVLSHKRKDDSESSDSESDLTLEPKKVHRDKTDFKQSVSETSDEQSCISHRSKFSKFNDDDDDEEGSIWF